LQPPYRPPLLSGSRDYNGDPVITCTCTLATHPDSNKLDAVVATVYMSAIGTKNDPPHAEGKQDFLLFTAQPGQHVRQYLSASSDAIDRAVTTTNRGLDWEPADMSGSFDRFDASLPEEGPLFLRQIFAQHKAEVLARMTVTNNGLVKNWRIWGDQTGDDVEVYTGVQVTLNPVLIELESDASDADKAKATAASVSEMAKKFNFTDLMEVRVKSP